MANAVVNRQVNVYINSGEAAKAYDVLIKREKILNEELAKTTDPKRIKALGAELNKLKEPIERAAKKMKGELAPSIRDLELATRKFLAEFKKTGDPATLANFQKFQAQLTAAKAQLNGLSEANKGLTAKGIFSGAFWASLAAGAVTAAASGIFNFFKGTISEALNADEATRRLQGTLDNLGRSDTFDRITRKADEMAQKFRYLDNDDIVGVFNKLIDYGKLTEKEMNDLLPVIIDFAAKSQISIDESASVIIKAMEGNAKALKEYGIDVADAGTVTERLNILMTTLKEKVDGSGEAFQNSAKGGIAVMRQEMANLKEDIGNEVLPALNKLLQFAIGAIKGLKQFGRDLWNTITGRSSGDGGGGEDNAAKVLNDRFLGSLANKKPAEKLKAINDEIEFFNERLKQNAPLLEKATKNLTDFKAQLESGDSRVNTDNLTALKSMGENANKLKSDADYFNARIKFLKDEIALQSKVNLGIDGSGGGGTGSGGGTKKTAVEKIQEMATAWEEYYKVQEKGAALVQKIGDANEKIFEQTDKLIAATIAGVGGGGIDAAGSNARFDRNRMAGLDLQVLTSRGKDNLKAQLAVLKEQQRLELDNKELTENEKLLIEEKYREKRKELELNFNKELVQNIVNYANVVLSVLSLADQVKTDKENAELERDRSINEKKQKNLDARLKKGAISQRQYDLEIQKIEREQEKREKEIRIKQFRRQQRQQLLQAIINTAEAVTEALPNLILAAIVGAAGAAQIGIIASQKAPEFAAGGKLGGRSHATGGNAVIDGQGRKIAEVEAGEGIVNKRTMADGSRYALSGTPSQIISRLNSMHGVAWDGGATLIPGWRNYSPQRMNYATMKRMYARGGIMSNNAMNEAADNGLNESLLMVLSDMQGTLASLQANGIPAYTILTQQEKQQARLDAIRNDATMKG